MKFIWPESGRAELRSIDREIAIRILHALAKYRESGSGDIKALTGQWHGYFRIRIGDYRVIFTIAQDEITIVRPPPVGYLSLSYGRWLTFVHNHAKLIVACDSFVVVTATFRNLYVFVLMEVGSRRILHHNATAHPTAEWTLQQFR